MKKWKIIVFIFFGLYNLLFAVEKQNYNGGNGTIVFEKQDKKSRTIIRKCEMEVKIGNLANDKQKVIYDSYDKKNQIGKLKENDKNKMLEIYKIEYFEKPKNDWGDVSGELWYKIFINNQVGWIRIDSDYTSITPDFIRSNPYKHNRWEVIDKIKISGKQWTIRSLKQWVAVWKDLNIRDKPVLAGSEIIFTIKRKKNISGKNNIKMIAMTEESAVIDGVEDHWLKIEYKGYVGWIFGGFATVERGGPKYLTPENCINSQLGWY